MPTTRTHLEAFRTLLVRVYLPVALCFFVINLTNTRILAVLQSWGIMYASTTDVASNAEKTARFFVIPVKSLIFFIATAVLIAPLAIRLIALMKTLLKLRDILSTLRSLGFSLLLTATIFPVSFGRSYARISTDPFAQEASQIYRRLLIPGLANLYHLDGFLYVFLFWALVFLAALVMRLYFVSKGSRLSGLQEVSLLTVGIFASAFQVPGYPEVLVLLLGVFALIEFDTDGVFTSKQVVAFSLAMMAHESCAIIVFAPLILFLFGRKSWLPCGAVLALYLGFMLANFSFSLSAPLQIQSNISQTPARVFFIESPGTVLMAAGFAFKAMWIVIAAGIFYLFAKNVRLGLVVLSGLVLSCASTYIAIDYTRLVGFATIPLILCFQEVQERFSPKLFGAVVILNILIPSLYVGGNCGALMARGLYRVAYHSFLKLPAPS